MQHKLLLVSLLFIFCLPTFGQIKSIEDAKNLAAGTYTFDFGNGPFQAYVDNDGWLLWLQYHHKGGTDTKLQILNIGKNLPIYDPSGLGTDNSTNASKWGHGSQLFAKSIPDKNLWLRWEATTAAHSRKIHFISKNIGKFQDLAASNFLDISKSFIAMPDHTAHIPLEVNGSPPSPNPDEVLTHGPFWKFSEYHWFVGGNRWEVDDEETKGTQSTIHRIWVKPNAGPNLNNELVDLKNHILGLDTLTPQEINFICNTVQQNSDLFQSDTAKIVLAMDVITTFDKVKVPLFMSPKTINGFNRDPVSAPGLELERTILCIQQILIDKSYSTDNLKRYPSLFKNFYFKCSSIFPGAVNPPTNPNNVEIATVKCQFLKPWGTQPWYAINPLNTEHAIRPTGCYLAPGSLATIEVPASLVGKGFAIRVGAHVWDLSNKSSIKRMDRVSIQYNIDSTHIIIANPLGGGIYMYVPIHSDEGIVEIKLKNVVRSPFYSHKSFDKTSIDNWKNIEMNHSAPWTDFESDKVFAQVPTSWIKKLLRPDSLMNEWDKTINATQDMLGRPRYSDCHQNYFQIDVIIRGGAYHPGYPMSNTPYNPWATTIPNSLPFIDGPRKIGDVHYHEYGHQVAISKFSGETEALVNFMMVAAFNNEGGLGGNLDTTFKNSFVPSLNMFMDDAAEQRMITETFRQGKPRDISNTTTDEVRYQQRGYAYYAEIVKMFGWCALENFWYGESKDFQIGKTYDVNNPDQDDRIYRMSIAANKDLRPLLHFYGIHPKNPIALDVLIKNANILSSSKIFDRLTEFKKLLPKNNAEFLAHALERFPNGLSAGANADPNYGIGWYYKWSKIYDESHGSLGLQALNNVIQLYFPNGRPITGNAEPTSCELNLTPGRITGFVKDIDNKPLNNVEITLDDNNPNTTSTKVLTNIFGYYEFNQITQGSYRLIQTQPNGYTSVSDFDFEEDGDVSDTISIINNQIEVTIVPGEDDNQNNFIEKESTVKVSDVTALGIIIYPNPAKSHLNIIIEDPVLQEASLNIEVYSMQGIKYLTASKLINPQIITLDISNLESDQMYLVVIKSSNNKTIYRKFVKVS